jgi:hypothetical protein
MGAGRLGLITDPVELAPHELRKRELIAYEKEKR